MGISPKKRAIGEQIARLPASLFHKPTRHKPSRSLYRGVIVVRKRKMKTHSFFRNDLIIFQPLKVKQKTLSPYGLHRQGFHRNKGLAGITRVRRLAPSKGLLGHFNLTARQMMIKFAAVCDFVFIR